MADDIFLTPEEQDERARQWLKDNGPALAIGVALGLAAIFGYDQYRSNKETQAEQASALYAATLDEVNDSSLSNIDAQVTELKENHSGSSYAAKAALLKAKQLSVTDLDAAYKELQWVIDNADEAGLQHTARIRQAKIKLSQGDLAQAKALASYTPAQGFDSNYAELLAEVSLKEGDEAAARTYFQQAIDTLPSAQSSYARVLSLKLDRLPAPEAELEQTTAVEKEAEPIQDNAEEPSASVQEPSAETKEPSAETKEPSAEIQEPSADEQLSLPAEDASKVEMDDAGLVPATDTVEDKSEG